MIGVSEQAALAIASRSFRMICRATITRAGRVLARDLPVDVGREEGDRTLRVPERVMLQVPKRVDGVDWTGDGFDSPVAPYGQRLHVKIGVDVGADGYEWINRGEFLIHDTDLTGPTVTINAVGLLALHDEARLVAPFKPTGTVMSCVRKLTEPGLTVAKHADVVDAAVNTGLAYDDDRLAAIIGFARSIAARPQVHPDGYLQILPGGPNPSITYQQGQELLRLHSSGTDLIRPSITDLSTAATRDGIFNTMVVRGETAAGAPVVGVAYDYSGGPGTYGGPFNPMPVPDFFYWSHIPNTAFANTIARVTLAERLAPFRRSWRVDAVPNPMYQVRDALQFYPDGDLVDAEVDQITLPYTAASGRMELTVRERP
jgi:hypothetical protein